MAQPQEEMGKFEIGEVCRGKYFLQSFLSHTRNFSIQSKSNETGRFGNDLIYIS